MKKRDSMMNEQEEMNYQQRREIEKKMDQEARMR